MTKTTLRNKSTDGFTLIEVLIYITLFAFIMGGSIISITNIIRNTEITQSHVVAQEEANFILSKINWALDGATSFSVATSTQSLTVQKMGTTLVFSYDTANKNMALKRGTATATLLNNYAVKVDAVQFTKTTGPPDKLQAAVTVEGIAHQLNYTSR
ncbi:MAG TPA: prepilin-type N-terminal cleavage/methylation domain-containing protein [Patescibacteria group bacterium]|nr:prepilin-type N-terminal cleavage/methylation domain-containing protein [Patescibacteria group bacterium]